LCSAVTSLRFGVDNLRIVAQGTSQSFSDCQHNRAADRRYEQKLSKDEDIITLRDGRVVALGCVYASGHRPHLELASRVLVAATVSLRFALRRNGRSGR
jgi:hypothetical protein